MVLGVGLGMITAYTLQTRRHDYSTKTTAETVPGSEGI